MDRDDMDRLVQYRDFLYRRAITWDEQAHTPPVSNDDFRDKGRSQGSYDALSELHRTFPELPCVELPVPSKKGE